MGLFGKNKNKEFENGHNDALFNDDDDYISPLRRSGEHRVAAPHALTKDEVIGVENIPMRSGERPVSGSVYESMKEHEKGFETQGFGDEYVPSWVSQKKDDIAVAAFSERSKIEMTEEETAVAAKRAEEILKSTNVRTETIEPTIPIDSGRSEITASVIDTYESESAAAFLERCKMAVSGNVSANTEPETVIMEGSIEKSNENKAEPSKAEDFESIIRRLKGEISEVEVSAEETEKLVIKPAATDETQPMVTAEAELKETESVAPREVNVEVEVIPANAPTEIMHTAGIPPIPATAATTVIPPVPSDVKIYGRVVHGKVIQQTPDGDVEVAELIKAQKQDEAMEATRMFDGLDDIISQKAEESFNDSRELYEGDYEDYDEEEDEVPYYESEDKSLDGVDEYKDLNDAARLRTAVQAEVSSGNVKSAISFVIFAVLLLLSLPIMDLMPIKASGIISLILLIVSAGVNIDIFKEFKNIGAKPGFDICVALTAVLTAVQTGMSAFVYDGQFPFLAAFAGLMLAVNRAVKLAKVKRLSKGLQIIGTSEPKNAVKTVDANASKIMASGAVQGEVIGLCATETVNLQNFVKNSSYKSPFDLKVKVLFFVGLAVSAAVGVAAGLLLSAGAGVTLAAAMMGCCYPVSALLSAEMPLNRITNRLFDKGAVLAGFKGAYDINLSNVITVNTSDLFPEGTVKLYNMKTLGENEIGQTLTAAAAVAIAAKSPLAGVFREMVGVSNDGNLPKVNGVQYEDKMGISGWIDDNTVLIGNRNLMQGHNIPVPPAAVDQKILKAGYFPVYIACRGVPCLLFVVKYEVDPEVGAELKRLCNTGMTVLVNPQDPNASEAMICDYFGIPDDALKVMKHNGRVVYERETKPRESISAPALFGKDVTGFFSAVTSSINLSSVIALLTAVYIISAGLGAVLLIYLAIMGKLSVVTAFAISAYQIIFMLISAIAMKVKDR